MKSLRTDPTETTPLGEGDTEHTSVGAGSHLFGLIPPFMRGRLKKKLKKAWFLAVESETSAKLTAGTYDYVAMEGPLARVSVKAYQVGWQPAPDSIKGMGIQTREDGPKDLLLNYRRLMMIFLPRIS